LWLYALAGVALMWVANRIWKYRGRIFMAEAKKRPPVVNVLIVLALAVAVAVAFVAKNADKAAKGESSGEGSAPSAFSMPQGRGMPMLVDLGSTQCLPCKMMKPILAELQRDYSEHFETVFIDVWENEAVQKQYGIRMIPTQIFYDAEGKELFRNEGFFSKANILSKWKELGLQMSASE